MRTEIRPFWFTLLHYFVTLVILAGLLKVILRKSTESSRVSLPSHPRGLRLMPALGLCQQHGLLSLMLLLDTERSTANLLTPFPLAVSLNPVTQFGRILDQTESAELKSGVSPYSTTALHTAGLCYEMLSCLPPSPHPLHHIKKTISQTLGCCLHLAAGRKLTAQAC